jgi:adenylyl- and sulfurtransferase ThiI
MILYETRNKKQETGDKEEGQTSDVRCKRQGKKADDSRQLTAETGSAVDSQRKDG